METIKVIIHRRVLAELVAGLKAIRMIARIRHHQLQRLRGTAMNSPRGKRRQYQVFTALPVTRDQAASGHR